MEVFIKENKKSITVGFKHGFQTFYLERFAKGNINQALWYKSMLMKCFAKFEIDILTTHLNKTTSLNDEIINLKQNY